MGKLEYSLLRKAFSSSHRNIYEQLHHIYTNVGRFEDSQISKIISLYNSGNLNKYSPISTHVGVRFTPMSWANPFLKIYTYKKLSK